MKKKTAPHVSGVQSHIVREVFPDWGSGRTIRYVMFLSVIVLRWCHVDIADVWGLVEIVCLELGKVLVET